MKILLTSPVTASVFQKLLTTNHLSQDIKQLQCLPELQQDMFLHHDEHLLESILHTVSINQWLKIGPIKCIVYCLSSICKKNYNAELCPVLIGTI